ncbi:artemisinic aldehyde Delta(11(13)) reductase [Sporocytophaga myxococcoides]|uniref:Artemisinic aldehyde Delta(11(13)) reductase n=2 Tax=Sporocytophaga myxococcoides TaxID=153721 RepID=A0A098L862_9BACT|nr:artemisinic aldehyde Delta(11(13)) reductase [Sporocytophaga myxococcoides]
MAPMTRSRAINSIPGENVAIYYAQRASAGLIITEGTAPSANGIGYARTPGIFTKEQIDGWKKVTKAVHDKGGKIIVQLMHVGRIAHPANMLPGSKIVAPSAVVPKSEMWTDTLGMQPMPQPSELTEEEIRLTVAEFAQAAKNAVEAGFDGVELHGANGYLIEQFINPSTNKRTDAYGGSTENRSRFLIETANAVIAAIGKDKVGVRISPYNTFNDLELYPEITETYKYIAEELNKLDILYLHIIDALANASEEGRLLVAAIRKTFNKTLILAGGYDKARAEQAIEEGRGDLVSFGRFFISNPDLPERFRNNAPLAEGNQQLFYAAGDEGYTDYSSLN